MKSRPVTWWWGCAWALAALLVEASLAAAQPRPTPRAQPATTRDAAPATRDATVVKLDADDVYLDLGREAVTVGTTFEVLRTIETRHPLTRAVLRDRFPIARLVVTQVGETLSIARLEGAPHRAVQLGDLARAPQATPPATLSEGALPICPPVAAPQQCPQVAAVADPRAVEVLRVWAATFGLLPESRVRVWNAFVASSPASPYVRYARAEIAEAQRELSRARGAEPTSGVLAELAPLGRAYVGEPVAFAGIVARGVRARDLAVYVRARGTTERGFTRAPMTIDAAGHARVDVPARLVALPGFEWFGEVTLEDGRKAFVAGSPTSPIDVEVWASPDLAPDVDGRSRVRFSTDYVDFNRARGNDYYVAVEGDFAYRLGLSFLPSVRVGYGHLQGESGAVDALARGEAPREVGFTYGFVEPEVAFHELFAVAVRVTAGLGLPERRVDGLRGGVQLRARIGRALGTNLVVAGETIPELGLRGYIGLQWLPVAEWPMAAEVHVTDQPRNGDIAVRGVFEVGHRFGRAFALSARLSYQGRNIEHSGLGAGLALTFDW